MPSDTLIEQRLKAVEDAVADIQRRAAEETQSPNWVERFAGAFKNEPAFAEVVAHGRVFRQADRPPGDDKD